MNKSPEAHSRRTGRAYTIAAALLWGLAGVCGKSIPWSAFSIIATRCGIGTVMTGISQKSFSPRCNKYTFAGAFMMSLTSLFYMISIKLTTAATAIVLQYIAPILVFLFTVIVQKKKPRPVEACIVFSVFLGCVFSFADGLDATRVAGNIFGLLSGLTFAAQIIIFGDERADAQKGVFVSNLMSFVCCLPFLFVDKSLVLSRKVIFWVLVMGIFQYGLAGICYSKGCSRIDKIETSLFLTIEPIFNPFPVYFVTGEKPGTSAIIGFVIVITAVTLYGLLPVIDSKTRTKGELT